MSKKKSFYVILVIFLITFFILGLLSLIVKYEKSIEKEMFKVSTSDVLQITENQAHHLKYLLKESKNYIDDIQKNQLFREMIEEHLSIMITKNIKYAYIVYKDEKNIFRFLVDGSLSQDKAMLNQKFDVVSPQWFEIYKIKKPMMINHTMLQKLSLTYLVPILNNQKEVELILVVDFSIDTVEKVHEIITMMKVGLYLILGLSLLFLVVFIYQIIKYKDMKKSSFTDKLTALYNRNFLHEIQDEVDLEKYIIAAVDIDHFKETNDTYGHDAGDAILREVGNILLHTVRIEEDMAIRYGGEEFVIFIKTKPHESDTALNVIQRIATNIKEHKMFINDKDYIYITVSIGVNIAPAESKNFLEAFKLADLALYKAKDSGRDKVVIYQEE